MNDIQTIRERHADIESEPLFEEPAQAELLGTFVHDSPEWHAARAGGIGGSEIAAMLGLSPFESRYSLWHRKAGTIEPQQRDNDMNRGHYLEPSIAAWFADQHPEYAVRRAGTYCHARRSWQRANPDRLLTAPRGMELLEIKSDRESWKWGTPGTDEIPVYYRTQVIWYLDVLGLDVGWVAVLLGGLDFAEYRIEYNPAEADMLRDEAREFLDSIEAGTPPDIDAHSQTYQVIRELHPEIERGSVEITPDLAEDFIDARISLKQAEKAEQLAKSRLAEVMGSAQRAVCNRRTIATRQAKDGGRPYVVAARKLPDPTELTGVSA